MNDVGSEYFWIERFYNRYTHSERFLIRISRISESAVVKFRVSLPFASRQCVDGIEPLPHDIEQFNMWVTMVKLTGEHQVNDNWTLIMHAPSWVIRSVLV